MVVKCDNEGVQMKTHDILDKDERTVAKAGGMPINLKVYAKLTGRDDKGGIPFLAGRECVFALPGGGPRGTAVRDA